MEDEGEYREKYLDRLVRLILNNMNKRESRSSSEGN